MIEVFVATVKSVRRGENKTVEAEKGVVDIVVANAAFVELCPSDSVTPEHFDKTFARTLGVSFLPFRRRCH